MCGGSVWNLSTIREAFGGRLDTRRHEHRQRVADDVCSEWSRAARTDFGKERALDLDSDGQLVASVLSKKAAAGASHLVLDLPVGPTAKVRSATAAASTEANRIMAVLP